MLALLRARLSGLLACLAVLAPISGCDSGSFAPPPPPELADLSSATRPKATAIELIVPGETNPERDAWVQAARSEAGRVLVTLAVAKAPTTNPSAWQVEQVRSAPNRAINVLIVEPTDPPAPELADALEEIRGKGIEVLLVDHALKATSGSAKPFPLLKFGPLDGVARALTGAAVTESKKLGLQGDGHALIVSSANPSKFGEALATVFREDLLAKGLTEVNRLRMPPGEGDEPVIALRSKIEGDPKTTIVLGVDPVGVTSILSAHNALKSKRDFTMGGAISFDTLTSRLSLQVQLAGLIDRKLPNFGRMAVRTAVTLAEGGKVEPELIVPLDFEARKANLGPAPGVPPQQR